MDSDESLFADGSNLHFGLEIESLSPVLNDRANLGAPVDNGVYDTYGPALRRVGRQSMSGPADIQLFDLGSDISSRPPLDVDYSTMPRHPPTKRKASTVEGAIKPMPPPRASSIQPSSSSAGPTIKCTDVFGSSIASGNRVIVFGQDAIEPEVSESTPTEHEARADLDASRFLTHFAFEDPEPDPGRSLINTRLARYARDRALATSRFPTHDVVSALLISAVKPCTGLDSVADDTPSIRYLPLCLQNRCRSSSVLEKGVNFGVLPSHRNRIQKKASRAPHVCWPGTEMPVELFELIISFLSNDDVKAMRLVSHEFEKKVSRSLFHTSVVPFNTELYDMIEEDTKNASRLYDHSTMRPNKGKGRAIDIPTAGLAENSTGRLCWQNAKLDMADKVYRGHGLRVFRGFGPYIRRFGMSFEVTEEQMCRPPAKKLFDHVKTYYGSYDWPPEQYTRFEGLAGLERTADDTLRMISAFSHLHNTQELALSLDSGLGWLCGPDKSIRARILGRPSSVFGQSRQVPDRSAQEASALWTAIQQSQRSSGPGNRKEVSLDYRPSLECPSKLCGLRNTSFENTSLWSSISADNVLCAINADNRHDKVQYGVLYTTTEHLTNNALPTSITGQSEVLQEQSAKPALVPACLTKEQSEWLLETEWAQRAFLECYMLAITDTRSLFASVKTMNLAKISSGLLTVLNRRQFWDALPGLKDVTILVKPDWRSVDKDSAGYCHVNSESVSNAVQQLINLLENCLVFRRSIQKLNIGWAGGGERAEGIFARNNHVLPAPILQMLQQTLLSDVHGYVQSFPFVEHLTLTNCWLTPPMLESLIRSHAQKSLKMVTLDSVSLTTNPRYLNQPANQGVPATAWQQWIAANPQLFAQAGFAGLPTPALPPAQPPVAGHGPGPQALVHQAMDAATITGGLPNPHNATMQGTGPAITNPATIPTPGPAGVNSTAPAAQAMFSLHSPQWTVGHRDSSWPDVLDRVSPGPRFADYQPAPLPWQPQMPEREHSNLQTLEFKSCGYACLSHASTPFDQSPLQSLAAAHQKSAWFRRRTTDLSSWMLTTDDRYFAKIVQAMPQTELNALRFAWGLTHGWQDAEAREGPQYDGFLPGGTGRFSGSIKRGMNLIGEGTPGRSR